MTRAALAVFAAALLLRAGGVILQGPPAPLAGDATEYRAYAVSLKDSGTFTGLEGRRASRMPGYPAFLAAVYSAFGDSTRAVQWTQVVLGALTCLFVYLWAAALLRPPWALAAGLAAACYYDLIAPSAWVLTESLYAFLLAGSFAILYQEKLSVRRRAALGGLGLGLTFLTRPEVLPFSILILGGAPLALKRFTRREAALALGVFLAVAAPWAARNALIFRRFIPVSTNGKFNVYLGLRLPLENQKLNLGPVHVPPPGLGELEHDESYLKAYDELRRAVTWPQRLRAYLFNALTVYYPFLPQYDWTYVLLVPFWLFGLWTAPSRRELWAPAGLVAGLSVVFAVLAGPVSRYRFGFAPALIVLAGAGAQALRDRAGDSRRFAWAAAGWTAANLVLWLGASQAREAVLRLKGWL